MDKTITQALPSGPHEARQTHFRSLADAYAQSPYAAFIRAQRLLGAPPIALVRFQQPAGAFPDPPTDDYTLAVNEQGSGRMRIDIGTGAHEMAFRLGDLVLKPPGVATEFSVDAPHRKSFISLPRSFVAEVAAEAAAPRALPDFGPLHDGSFRSAPVLQLLDLIWAESDEGNPHGRLFTEGAVVALVAMLLRLAAPQAEAAKAVRPLSLARLRRVTAWVEENLAESFGLNEMAASVCLSSYHFSRAFKASTGETPRAYVTSRRVEKAKDYLADPALPLAHVAQLCGFADQSHFTAIFGRWTGMTPGAYRRSLG